MEMKTEENRICVITSYSIHYTKLYEVTDGLGWHTTKRPLEETYNNNEYVFNLQMIEQGVLEELQW